MPHLFSPLRIASVELPNRVVMAALASGYAAADGFIGDQLIDYYRQRAAGGVGLVVVEAARVRAPDAETLRPHLGLYADVFVPGLCRLARAIHEHGARVLVTLDEPAAAAAGSARDLAALAQQFVLAAWRARAAACDGVMLSAADGGVLRELLSAELNRRADIYGGSIAGRLRLPMEIIEGVRAWMGSRFLIGFRLIAEEFVPGGMSLQDARVIAKRVVAAGVSLLDVTVDSHTESPVARFPGWCIPLANSIKRVIPDVPVIGSGLLSDPYLADSVVRDGSVDLVMLGRTLRRHPDWPLRARDLLSEAGPRHTLVGLEDE